MFFFLPHVGLEPTAFGLKGRHSDQTELMRFFFDLRGVGGC